MDRPTARLPSGYASQLRTARLAALKGKKGSPGRPQTAAPDLAATGPATARAAGAAAAARHRPEAAAPAPGGSARTRVALRPSTAAAPEPHPSPSARNNGPAPTGYSAAATHPPSSPPQGALNQGMVSASVAAVAPSPAPSYSVLGPAAPSAANPTPRSSRRRGTEGEGTPRPRPAAAAAAEAGSAYRPAPGKKPAPKIGPKASASAGAARSQRTTVMQRLLSPFRRRPSGSKGSGAAYQEPSLSFLPDDIQRGTAVVSPPSTQDGMPAGWTREVGPLPPAGLPFPWAGGGVSDSCHCRWSGCCRECPRPVPRLLTPRTWAQLLGWHRSAVAARRSSLSGPRPTPCSTPLPHSPPRPSPWGPTRPAGQ